jgi:hypothetical protein
VRDRPLPAVLVERELLGAGEAEALLRTALADATFAVVGGRVDGWAEAPAAPLTRMRVAGVVVLSSADPASAASRRPSGAALDGSVLVIHRKNE